MIINPTFFEKDNHVEKAYDVYSRLLKDRVVLLFNEINDDVACSVMGQLLYLDSVSKDKDIALYINSPGGSVSSGFAIYDTMKSLHCDVSTICVGTAASMGAFLLAGGTKGKRYALPNSQIMLHQVLSSFGGQSSDIAIHADHTKKIQTKINQILADPGILLNRSAGIPNGIIGCLPKTPSNSASSIISCRQIPHHQPMYS